jgi:hypothetical protein
MVTKWATTTWTLSCEGANGKTLDKLARAKAAPIHRLGAMVEQIYNRNGSLNETLSETTNRVQLQNFPCFACLPIGKVDSRVPFIRSHCCLHQS